MLGEGGTDLDRLMEAIRAFVDREERYFDLKVLRSGMDALEGEFATQAREVRVVGGHLASGAASVVSWIGRTCGMSSSSVADRLCVGAQLESLPKIAEALRTGEIGYQSTALLCHLRDQLGEKRDLFDEDEMLDLARKHSVASLRYLCRYARHVADPDGFFKDAEADYSRRRLHISQMSDGMHAIDGVLDPAGGAALKTALDSLSHRRGQEDDRTLGQRTADALVEMAHPAMDEGRFPRRNGVKPHITL